MPQFHWWAWPLLAAILLPWALLRSKPVWWTKFAFVRLGRVGPLLVAERREDEAGATDYRAAPASTPRLPSLDLGRQLDPEGATFRAVGPSTALVKARHPKPRFGRSEILGMVTIEVVRGDDNTVHVDARFAPPPGTTLLALAFVYLLARGYGSSLWLYVVPLTMAWQIARGYEQHRELLPVIKEHAADLFVTSIAEGDPWRWARGGAKSEAAGHAPPRKTRPKRAAEKT
jgi:hypothetical protein